MVERKVIRPKFSTPTELVLAGLDLSMPVNRTALDEMTRRGIIYSAESHRGLQRRLKAAGLDEDHFANLYAIPLRRPSEANGREVHSRSLHTENGGEKFVFKGSGLAGSTVSFKREGWSLNPETVFLGGARAETVKHTLRTLDELNRAFEQGQSRGDHLTSWAAVDHGINQLPVIRHAAVFRPLQILQGTGKDMRRVVITEDVMRAMNLEAFYGKERVHVYTASEPRRLIEGKRYIYDALVRDAKGSPSASRFSDLNKAILARFVTRGLLLLHTAHSAGITLTSVNGSPLSSHNVGPLEFFDLGTANYEYPRGSSRIRQIDCDKFANTVKALASTLVDYQIDWDRRAVYKGLRKALVVARAGNLNPVQKRKKLNEVVAGIVEAALEKAKD